MIPEPTKWEKIAGHYKVYDTTGVYLYDMDLVHTHNNVTNRDSIRFENFDGEFTFTAQQIETSNLPMYNGLYLQLNFQVRVVLVITILFKLSTHISPLVYK